MTAREIELGAVVALLVGLWEQARAIWRWLAGFVVVTRRADYGLAPVLLAYLRDVGYWRPRNDGLHTSHLAWVKSLGHMYRVFYQLMVRTDQRFLIGRCGGAGRRPVWYTVRGGGADGSTGNTHAPGESPEVCCLTFAYLRGTIDWEELLRAVAAWDELQRNAKRGESRHAIFRHVGSTGMSETAISANASIGDHARNYAEADAPRLLHWDESEIGEPLGSGLDHLALSPAALEIAREVAEWLDSREWYAARAPLAWRRGYLLAGPPGGGKTAFVRALAEEHGLPIHLFDLATMTNRELGMSWRGIGLGPAIVVWEDFDAVFDGREPRSPNIMLTFDAVLQVLDGVESASGLLVFITTNHPETLDEALLRPGRVDRTLVLGGLGREGRLKIARRILAPPGAPDAWGEEEIAEVVDQHPVESPAVFQEACVRLAIARRWGAP